jgi:transcriptional regulator GlxA family with amidase domain
VRARAGVPILVERFNQGAFSYYDRLTPVLRFVNAQVAKPISLDDGARLAGLERKYFSAFFHSKVGTTFTEWIRILRVKRSMELMRAHDESICRTAFAAGFRDVRTFERAFKRYVGVSPRAYRSLVRPEHDGCRERHDQRRADSRIVAHICSPTTK